MAPPAGSGPTVRRILLGSHLRRLRERKGISRETAGYHIRASESKISRLELGRVGFKRRDVEDLLTLYGITDETERAQVLDHVLEANRHGWWQPYAEHLPSWFHPYLDLEESASLIRGYESHLVPGLLQTEDYARAVMSRKPGLSHEVIEARVTVRMNRQKILARPDGPRLWMVVDETALHRRIGDRAVMEAQLRHLLTLTDLPQLTLQVTPLAVGCDAADAGAFSILRFPDPGLTDVVYLERLTGATYLDKRDDVDQYTIAMSQLSVESGTPANTAGLLQEILAKL